MPQKETRGRPRIYAEGNLVTWGLRVPLALKRQIEALARAERRPAANYLRCLLADHVRKIAGKKKQTQLDG